MHAICDKVQLMGAQSLSDAELLAVVLDDGAVAEPAELGRRVAEAFGGSLAGLARAETARLRMVAGVGLKRAVRLAAAVELGRRAAAADARAEVAFVTTSDDVIRLFRPQLEALPHEECWALFLSASNRIVERRRISQGGVQGTVVDHRLVVKRALELLATQMILVHNHPSGTAEPSVQDKVMTKKIADAAALFDIRLLDHIVIARSGEFSFLKNGLL